MTETEPVERPAKSTHGVCQKTDISVVFPVFNEAETLDALVIRTVAAIISMERSFELIAVDDGSSDDSLAVLERLASIHEQLKIVSFRRNEGQTAAMMAGIDFAVGKIIVTMDADLQNDPLDIPRLVTTLITENVDVVSGWRSNRKDARLTKNLPSRLANKLISTISGVQLRDYGCSLKVYRRHVLDGMRLYGEMHRFIPIYASWMGATIKEVPVTHHARQFGASNYGLERTFKVLLDIAVVKFLEKYLVKPIYVFGGFALLCFLSGLLCLLGALINKFAFGISLILTPLPLLAAMLTLVGFMSFFMGILAEVMSRTYFESQNRRTYQVKTKINFDTCC